MEIAGGALTAASQPLFGHAGSAVIPASGAASVAVDLVLPPNVAPERATNDVAYTLEPGSKLAPMIADLDVDAQVAIDRQAAIVIAPPVRGKGWLAASACCKPNLHRDLRVAIGGVRIETRETFAVDFAKIENNSLFTGDGKTDAEYRGFGQNVFAVADGTIVYVHASMPDETPFVSMVPKSKAHYGGNNIILQIAPNLFARYAHLRDGSITVKAGEHVKAGEPIGKVGNSGPSEAPHLHFGLLDKPDPTSGRSLPFVFARYTLDGWLDFDASKEDRLVIRRDARRVRSAHPLYGSIQNYP